MTLKPFGYALMAATLLATAACGSNNDRYQDRQRTDQIDQDSYTDRNRGTATGTAGSMTDTAGTAAADGTVTMKIQAKFATDNVVKGHDIDVDTRSGVVTLKGTVESDAQRQAAERLARETDGVTRVMNELRVETAPARR